jgi:soluble P-type ATPase
MIEVDIPGFRTLQLAHLVLDYNGTLAVDGRLLPGVDALLRDLSVDLSIHVLTADTFGLALAELRGLPVKLSILAVDRQAEAKHECVTRLGAGHVVAIGNGRNDRLMLQAASLGIAVLQAEGVAVETLNAARIVTPGIREALALLRHPKRLTATLRS